MSTADTRTVQMLLAAIDAGVIGTRGRLEMLINTHTILRQNLPEEREYDAEHLHHTKVVQMLNFLRTELERDVASMRHAVSDRVADPTHPRTGD